MAFTTSHPNTEQFNNIRKSYTADLLTPHFDREPPKSSVQIYILNLQLVPASSSSAVRVFESITEGEDTLAVEDSEDEVRG